jgi:hypothetical protein
LPWAALGVKQMHGGLNEYFFTLESLARNGSQISSMSDMEIFRSPVPRNLLCNPYRVMVGNQPPAPLLLYPDPGEPCVAGNGFAFVLSNHG